MFTLNIHNKIVYFKDIKPNDLPKILGWYNKVDRFRFATGIDSPITLEMLRQKYAEVVISKNEFFVGIYLDKELEMIGILKGNIKYNMENIMWISSVVIDPMYQNKGFGTVAVNLLTDHMKEFSNINEVYLAVIEDNIQGRTFWQKLNFQELRKMQNHLRLDDKPHNVIIMHKRL